MKINERRKAEKIFDEPRVVTWFIQLLLAVQYIHDRFAFTSSLISA